MDNFFIAIKIGASNFLTLAEFLTFFMLFFQIGVKKKLNIAKIALNNTFLFYMLCMVALIIFPLPDAAQAARLSTYDFVWQPLHSIADIVRESPLGLHNFHTYLPALFNRAVLQVALNVLMTVPFGMFLTYRCRFGIKKVTISTFFLSALFEVTQLTGLFFIYAGSYRVCDVDDLITNTLGGVLGYVVVKKCSRFLPKLERFDVVIPRKLFVKVSQAH